MLLIRGCGDSTDEEDRNVEPSRVDTVLSATQIGAYCSQVSKFSKSGLSKLFLVGSLHSQQGGAGN